MPPHLHVLNNLEPDPPPSLLLPLPVSLLYTHSLSGGERAGSSKGCGGGCAHQPNNQTGYSNNLSGTRQAHRPDTGKKLSPDAHSRARSPPPPFVLIGHAASFTPY